MLIILAIKVNFVTLPAGWLIIETPVSGTSWQWDENHSEAPECTETLQLTFGSILIKQR